jgi:hypothetical protein
MNWLQYGLTFDEYRARPGLSISQLKIMQRSPKHYRYALTHPKDSEPFALGKAAHSAVLEPERFESEFVAWSRRTSSGNMAPRNGKHWKAFQAEASGRTIITEEQYQFAVDIAQSIRSEPDAMKYLRTGAAEVSMFWQFMHHQCRGRVDWLHDSDEFGVVLVGLKTTQDCRHHQFSKQAKRLGYDLQWAYYYDGWKSISGCAPDRVVEICVETKPPHAVGVYTVPDEVLQRGCEQYMELLDLLDECERSGMWPGPNPAEQVITLPTWGDEEIIEGIDYVD